MTSISKNVYIDKLDDIANKYDNTYHSTINMKPVDVKSSKKINDEYKNIFAKSHFWNWSEKVLRLKN